MKSLEAAGCVSRREQLIASFTSPVDYVIITNPRHIFYLSGLYVTPLALSGWGLNFLTIDTSTGFSRLLIHNFIGTPEHAFVDQVDTWRWYDSATDPGTEPYRNAIPELNARLPDLRGKRVGTEQGWFPQGVAVSDPVDISPALAAMRRHKNPDELVLIREAVAATVAGQRAARETIRAGLTELDVYNAVSAGVTNDFGGAALIMGDFASGERARVGGAATRRVLNEGDLMIIDLFPIVNGYRGDITSTLAVGGALTPEQRHLESGLNDALSAGESMLRPGVIAGDVYRAVRARLAEYNLADGFTHHAGHGLGLGHPEAPFFVPNSTEVLIAGDVVTLEPGSYTDQMGARIEHNYLITETGCERLSTHNTLFGAEHT